MSSLTKMVSLLIVYVHEYSLILFGQSVKPSVDKVKQPNCWMSVNTDQLNNVWQKKWSNPVLKRAPERNIPQLKQRSSRLRRQTRSEWRRELGRRWRGVSVSLNCFTFRFCIGRFAFRMPAAWHCAELNSGTWGMNDGKLRRRGGYVSKPSCHSRYQSTKWHIVFFVSVFPPVTSASRDFSL